MAGKDWRRPGGGFLPALTRGEARPIVAAGGPGRPCRPRGVEAMVGGRILTVPVPPGLRRIALAVAGALAVLALSSAGAPALAGSGADIEVGQTGDAECRVGRPCAFTITVANGADAPFSAPMRIGDAIGIDGHGRLKGVPVVEVAPAFGCPAKPSALPFSCVAGLTLGARESRAYKVVVTIPDGGPLAGLKERVGAESCVGFVSPDAPVTGGAGGSSGRAPGGAYACHRFAIVAEPAVRCRKGFVANNAGRCVCPAGMVSSGKRCVKVETAGKCAVRGQVRDKRGQCACPQGTRLQRGACRKPEAEACPEGTVRKGGRCAIPLRDCPQGMVGDYPDCFPAQASAADRDRSGRPVRPSAAPPSPARRAAAPRRRRRPAQWAQACGAGRRVLSAARGAGLFLLSTSVPAVARAESGFRESAGQWLTKR